MEVEEMIYYDHDVVQRRSQLLGSWEEDKLFIRMQLYKCDSLSRNRTGDQVYEGPKLADTAFSIEFSHFKQQLCDSNVVEYETLICKHLKNMGVQGYEHDAIVQRIFDVVEAAVSPVNAVEVIVWDITSLPGDILDEPSLIPASRSAIHGLKSVTVPNSSSQSCSVCWEHLEGKLITRLPCTHHFHVDCIVQWLQINHLHVSPLPISNANARLCLELCMWYSPLCQQHCMELCSERHRQHGQHRHPITGFYDSWLPVSTQSSFVQCFDYSNSTSYDMTYLGAEI